MLFGIMLANYLDVFIILSKIFSISIWYFCGFDAFIP